MISLPRESPGWIFAWSSVWMWTLFATDRGLIEPALKIARQPVNRFSSWCWDLHSFSCLNTLVAGQNKFVFFISVRPALNWKKRLRPQSTKHHGIGLKTSTLERFSHDQKPRNEIELFTLSEGKKTDEKQLCDDDEYQNQNQTHPSSDSTSDWLMARAFFRRPIRLQSKRKTKAKTKQSCVYFRQSFENGSNFHARILIRIWIIK